jgi:hypothetical protein
MKTSTSSLRGTDLALLETPTLNREGLVIPTKDRRSPLWVVAAFALLFAGAAHAQQWSGEIGGAYVWQHAAGNEDSFRSQYNQTEGFLLEDLLLTYAPSKDAPQQFKLKAWGFGGAEPDSHAVVDFKPFPALKLQLAYDGRDSYFNTMEGDFARRANDWSIDRWKGSVVWDGFTAVRLTLNLRYMERNGTIDRPLYGLAMFYPMRVNLDETMKEAALRIETKTLPVHILFEQSLARYENKDRWSPLGAQDLSGTDADLLSRLSTDRHDKHDVPTSRLMAAYRNDRVDVAGSFLYSSSKLDSSGTSWTSFDIGGGSIGRISYIDELMGSARLDTRAANVSASFMLNPHWIIRASGDYQDSTSDSELLGQYLIRFGQPGGFNLELVNPANDNGLFDVTDKNGRLDLEYHSGAFAAWAGAFATGRDVSWRRTSDEGRTAVNRTSDGFVAGASYSMGSRLRASAEYERGTFEKYIFRVDPETVSRLSLRLNADLGAGWHMGMNARLEKGDNPTSQSGLKRRSDAYGMNCSWDSKNGRAGVGLDVDRMSMSTAVDLVLPTGQPGLSTYNLDLWTTTMRAHFMAGKVDLNTSVTRLRDQGETWPFATWLADARATLPMAGGMELSLFGQYRYYREDWAHLDNFEVTRYGFVVRWRF